MRVEKDDWESPYFDWANNRLFPTELCRLIDQIANDPRFSWGGESDEIAREIAGHLPEERFQNVKNSAWNLFDSTVGQELRQKAKPIVSTALHDPDFELLPPFSGEENEVTDDGYFASRILGEDPRLLNAIRMELSSSSNYQRLVENARKTAEADALTLYESLPIETRDRLVLATRIAEREQLLDRQLADLSPRRRAWARTSSNRTLERFMETLLPTGTPPLRRFWLLGGGRRSRWPRH